MPTIVPIDFHGDKLAAIRDPRGDFIPLRPMVEAMRLDWGSQLQRLKRDPILSRSVVMMTTENERSAVCLPLRRVAGFLFRIDASRIKDADVKAKVLDYQDQCYDTLDAALRPAARAPDPEAPPAQPIPPDRALRMVARAQAAFGAQVAQEVWFATGLIVTKGMRRAPMQASLFTYTAERTAPAHSQEG